MRVFLGSWLGSEIIMASEGIVSPGTDRFNPEIRQLKVTAAAERGMLTDG
ncbi:hypothetical protein WCLP8_4730013 [uncultured Gammaproteobacteria bacterium]